MGLKKEHLPVLGGGMKHVYFGMQPSNEKKTMTIISPQKSNVLLEKVWIHCTIHTKYISVARFSA